MTDVFPEEMIRYAITMFERAGQKSRKGYAEADKNPKTEYGLEQLKKGNIYSTFEILFSMVGVTMAGVNAVNKNAGREKRYICSEIRTDRKGK